MCSNGKYTLDEVKAFIGKMVALWRILALDDIREVHEMIDKGNLKLSLF